MKILILYINNRVFDMLLVAENKKYEVHKNISVVFFILINFSFINILVTLYDLPVSCCIVEDGHVDALLFIQVESSVTS